MPGVMRLSPLLATKLQNTKKLIFSTYRWLVSIWAGGGQWVDGITERVSRRRPRTANDRLGANEQSCASRCTGAEVFNINTGNVVIPIEVVIRQLGGFLLDDKVLNAYHRIRQREC